MYNVCDQSCEIRGEFHKRLPCTIGKGMALRGVEVQICLKRTSPFANQATGLNKCMFGAEGVSLGAILVCDLGLETSESVACSILTFVIIDFAYSVYLPFC